MQPQLSLETSHTAYFIFFNDFINIYLVTNPFIHMMLLFFLIAENILVLFLLGNEPYNLILYLGAVVHYSDSTSQLELSQIQTPSLTTLQPTQQALVVTGTLEHLCEYLMLVFEPWFGPMQRSIPTLTVLGGFAGQSDVAGCKCEPHFLQVSCRPAVICSA